jgi:hypothetical protein
MDSRPSFSDRDQVIAKTPNFLKPEHLRPGPRPDHSVSDGYEFTADETTALPARLDERAGMLKAPLRRFSS